MKLKVAFDFDDVLDQNIVQEYASDLINRGIDVWICTARMDNTMGNPNWNNDVFEIAQNIGISITNIIMTNGSPKSGFMYGNDFLWLLDDMGSNIEDLSKNNSPMMRTVPILFAPYNEWKQKCENILLKNKVK